MADELAIANDREQKEKTYDELESYHQMAIDMRLEGYTYFAISTALHDVAVQSKINKKFPESLIKQWFMRGGICRYAYDIKKKERAEERQKLYSHIPDQLKELANLSVVALKGRIRKGSVLASLEILKMVGFEAPKKLEIEDKRPVKVEATIIMPDGTSTQINSKPDSKTG